MHKILILGKKNLDLIYLILGNGISRFVIIVSSFIMIKFMGDELYGRYAVLYNAIISLQIIAGFGLNPIITKNIAQNEDPINILFKAIKITAFISLVTFTILYLIIRFNLIPSISYFKDLNFTIILFSSYSFVFFNLTISVLYGQAKKIKIATINIINTVIILLLLSLSSYLKNLDFIFLSFGIANFFSGLLVFFSIYSKKPYESKNNKNDSLRYIKQSFPVFLSALLVTPVVGVVYTLMNKYSLGENIAVFSIAMQWFAIILFIPGVISNLLLAHFSSNVNQMNINRYIKQVFINFSITVFISIFVFLILIVILPKYGAVYNKNINIFIIFIVTAIVNSLNTVVGQLFISIDKQWYAFLFNSIWAITIVSLISFFLKNGYGIYGVAWSFLLTYTLHAIIQNICVVTYFLKTEKNYDFDSLK